MLPFNILREQAELINYEAVSIKCYERVCVCVCVCVCILVLVTQHAMRMRRIILPSVACPAVTVFIHFISQTARFSEKINEHKMCVLVFFTTFVWNISHYEKN